MVVLSELSAVIVSETIIFGMLKQKASDLFSIVCRENVSKIKLNLNVYSSSQTLAKYLSNFRRNGKSNS